MKYCIVTLLILTFHNVHCQTQKSVKTENFNFTIELPPRWMLKDEYDRIGILGPIHENLGINFVEKTTQSLDQRFDYYIEGLKLDDNFKEINTGYEEINGLRYRWIEYEMENMGVLFHDFLYLTIHNKTLFSITLTSTKDRYKNHSVVLFEILRSLKMN